MSTTMGTTTCWPRKPVSSPPARTPPHLTAGFATGHGTVGQAEVKPVRRPLDPEIGPARRRGSLEYQAGGDPRCILRLKDQRDCRDTGGAARSAGLQDVAATIG